MPMKTATLSLCMMSSMAWAQATAPITTMFPAVCVDAETLSKTVDEFKELPFARGISIDLGNAESAPQSLVIFVNPRTQTWTIVERVDANQYCIMALGQKFEPVPADIRDRVEQERSRGES
jgi:hypothetical protein